MSAKFVGRLATLSLASFLLWPQAGLATPNLFDVVDQSGTVSFSARHDRPTMHQQDRSNANGVIEGYWGNTYVDRCQIFLEEDRTHRGVRVVNLRVVLEGRNPRDRFSSAYRLVIPAAGFTEGYAHSWYTESEMQHIGFTRGVLQLETTRTTERGIFRFTTEMRFTPDFSSIQSVETRENRRYRLGRLMRAIARIHPLIPGGTQYTAENIFNHGNCRLPVRD